MKQIIKRGSFLTLMFMLLGCLSLYAADNNLTTKQITIKLEKAGTLPDRIPSRKKYKVTNLKIIGEINGTDLRMIREMAGSKNTDGKLSVLDLSKAKIVEGGDYYYYDYDNNRNNYYYTSNDVIGDKAFCYCRGLTSLTLPDGITSIGYCAFFPCSGLTSLTIPAGITSLNLPNGIHFSGEGAFLVCSGLTSIYVYAEKVPKIGSSNVFEGIDAKKCTLYVPMGTSSDYWLSDFGDYFENIVEFDATDIDKTTISTDVEEVARYSVNGQRLSAPTKGLNIVKYSDGSVKKVAVR